MNRAFVMACVLASMMVGAGGALRVPVALANATGDGPPPAKMAESDDPLMVALLLIDEKYVAKPQLAQYRGMVGQGLLRIANAIGRSRMGMEDAPDEWTLQCAKRPVGRAFVKNAMASVEAVYQALHEAMALGKICAEGAPPPDLTYLAIKGMASTLDSQSYLIEPGKYEDIKTESQEAVTGELGLELEDHRGALVVSDVKLGMPADGAGIRLGDRLVRVDDAPVAGLSVARAEELLRGSVGSNVSLTVERDGAGAPLTLAMARQAHRFQSVKFQFLRGAVGYVRVVLFHGQTAQDLVTAFERLQALNMKALILDLRDNVGGLLNAAIGVAESFIPRDALIVVVNGRGERRDEHRSQAAVPPFTAPIVVLINQRTASSAEIVAAALRDWQRAILVGTKSHGKGSVQSIYPLPGHYALRLTTAYYVTPLGKKIDNEGIEPDVVVENKDEQLAKALELLFKNAPSLQGK
ncbi:MAG: S41 family peptidase [Nitrospirae bacterium]|nr:MAG: S41 family peptidase [Nitrospirota bacterium]